MLPLFVAVTLCPAMLTTGDCMASSAVKLRVITSPTFALSVLLLEEAILTTDKVGGVLSNTTLLLLVVVVTVVPALPARSLKAMLKVMVPSVSVASMVWVAVQLLPLVLVAVTVWPAMLTEGVFIISEEPKGIGNSICIYPFSAGSTIEAYNRNG